MNKVIQNVKKHWYAYIIEIIIFVQVLVFMTLGENSYIAIHDNLDLFVPQLHLMKINDAFFESGIELPMLGGISRDLFGSEFSLYNILYVLFPSYMAYIIGYFLKILIGYGSFIFLVKEIYPNTYKKYFPIASLMGLCYGLIPVFPAYGIAFTSVPLLLILLRRLYMDDKKPYINKLEDKTDRQAAVIYRGLLYLGVFLYPMLSYFSYHGFFLLCYMCAALIILWIRDRKFPRSLMVSIIVLSVGYVVFEHRLFEQMLLSDEITIRTTMVNASYSATEALREMFDVFLDTIFHAQDSHLYVALPVSVVGLILVDGLYIREKKFREMFADPVNQIFGIIVFNCIICGLYDVEAFRSFIEKLVPQLTGFQLNRTIFFNPLLWYGLLFVMLKKLYDAAGITYIRKDRKGQSEDAIKDDEGRDVSVRVSRVPARAFTLFANCIAVIAVIVVTFEPQVYNDFFYTCYNHAYKIIKHQDTSTLNYREFYSVDLFDEVKSDLEYKGEWAVAYGMHPGILSYNGISTLDGYLGFYTQEYKDKFAKVIEPALNTAPEFNKYFTEWGARAYIYSDEDINTYAPYRYTDGFDTTININEEALKDMGCKYFISRVQITNADEQGLVLRGIYENEESPYTIFVYTLL